MRNTVDRAAARGGDTADLGRRLGEAVDELAAVVDLVQDDDDVASRSANASALLDAFGHTVVGWLLLDQLGNLNHSHSAEFAAGKRSVCRYFFHRELPLASHALEIVACGEDSAFKMADAWF